MYKVILHKNAAKFYSRASKKKSEKIKSAIDSISINPHFNIHIKKLKGEFSGMHRYRIGEIRILYEIHENIKIVRIKAMEERGSVYK